MNIHARNIILSAFISSEALPVLTM